MFSNFNTSCFGSAQTFSANIISPLMESQQMSMSPRMPVTCFSPRVWEQPQIPPQDERKAKMKSVSKRNQNMNRTLQPKVPKKFKFLKPRTKTPSSPVREPINMDLKFDLH